MSCILSFNIRRIKSSSIVMSLVPNFFKYTIFMLHSHNHDTYTCGHIVNTIMTNEHTSLKKYTSHTFFEMFAKVLRKGFVWEVSWRLNKLQHSDHPVPLSLAVLLSRPAGLLNRGSWGSIAIRWVLVLSTASYLQLTDFNYLDFLSHRVISSFTSTSFL